jgi:hypothetical protein
MRAFEDGWIDHRSRDRSTDHFGFVKSADEVRREIEAFRGRVLSLTYNLERLVDALIVWYLFRDREDGMASVFEEDILHSGALGLERKVRLARAIAKDWLYDEEGDPADYGRAIAAAKSHRDQVAHWPTRLQPLEDSDGNVVNYAVFIEKGAASTELTSDTRDAWFAGIEDASSRTQAIINRITKHIRSGLE